MKRIRDSSRKYAREAVRRKVKIYVVYIETRLEKTVL
jgi:hypothetical protein